MRTCAPETVTKLGQKPCTHEKSLLQADWLIWRLRPNSVSRGSTEMQFDAFEQSPQPSQTNSLMNTRRSGSSRETPLAAAALLGGAGLVVDHGRDTRPGPKLLLHGVEFTAVVNRGALGERPTDPVLVRLVRYHREPPHAFGAQLVRDPLRGQRTIVRLAARHCHGIVVEHLVRDARAGRDGGSDRQESEC